MAWSKTGNIKGPPGTPPALGSPITAVPTVAGVATVDLSLGDYFTIALNVNATLAFSNPPAAGTGRTVDVTVTQDNTGGWTLTLPSSMHPIGASDTAIQSAAGAKTKIIPTTIDAGTTFAYSMDKVA